MTVIQPIDPGVDRRITIDELASHLHEECAWLVASRISDVGIVMIETPRA